MIKSDRPTWSLQRAREFYNILVWSEGYFDINNKGHVVVKPDELVEIDLLEVTKQLHEKGLSFPILIRFPQILQARIQELCNAFSEAERQSNCGIKHIPFYPIKVNQQRTVIEKLLSGHEQEAGLEVGSKTELLVALGVLDSESGMLICNGYKDRAYVRIALHAQCMGIDVVLVVENLSELTLIREESLVLNITPKLGVRIRLNSVAAGNWQNSGGTHAKFGLGTNDVLKLLDTLKSWGGADWLSLLHFHMGSQISNLNDFSTGLNEALCVYGEFYKRGFVLEYLDVGGGLAVDYSSLQDASYFSKTYSIQEYANTITETINVFCKAHDVPIPVVCTENGRALTAHHAVLVTNILEVDNANNHYEEISNAVLEDEELQNLADQLITSLKSDELNSTTKADKFLATINADFLEGRVSLDQRAWAEQLVYKYQLKLDQTAGSCGLINHDKYYCNFSMFQSIPDIWGLNQVFPIMPLSRLEEEPTNSARLHDLTCDSDGQVSQYAVDGALEDNLRLHPIQSSREEYLIGFFLLGAYQEVLGDMHNLFGDTHTVNVEKEKNGELLFTEYEVGDCVDELLSSVHLSGEQIIACCNQRLSNMGICDVEQNTIMNEIKSALFGYTYLDSINRPAHRIKK